jgi:hypothetical protein
MEDFILTMNIVLIESSHSSTPGQIYGLGHKAIRLTFAASQMPC